MDPNQPFFSEHFGHTTLHPVGVSVFVLLSLATLFASRRYALLPLCLLVCLMGTGQRLIVLTLDLDFIRLLVFILSVRIFSRGEHANLKLGRLDTVFLAWTSLGLIMPSLARGNFDALLTMVGHTFAAVGMYFSVRCLIRDGSDVSRLCAWLAMISIPVATAFSYEFTTATNPFHLFGGVPEVTDERFGALRCQGPFPHPIIAGCFWASLLPLIATGWWDGGSKRILAVIGLLNGTAIVLLSNSSTPVMALFFGIIGVCFFPVRNWIWLVKWMLPALVIGLHLWMQGPVWHLIARVNIISGSTSYYRYLLIDAWIHHFSEWALVGTPTSAHWGPGLIDVTNHYIIESMQGGLLKLSLFVCMFALAFSAVSRIWNARQGGRKMCVWGWAAGVALFVHSTSFLGVAYFGWQIVFALYLVLGMVGSMDVHLATSGLQQLPARQTLPSRNTPRHSRVRRTVLSTRSSANVDILT